MVVQKEGVTRSSVHLIYSVAGYAWASSRSSLVAIETLERYSFSRFLEKMALRRRAHVPPAF